MAINALAVAFVEPGKAEIHELALPEPTDDDLVVRVEYTGISVGTERWAFDDYRSETVFPVIAGYLGFGVVERVGASVTGFAKGDRVHFTRSRLPEPYERNWMGAHLSRAVVTPGSQIPFVIKLPDAVSAPAGTLSGLGAVSFRGTSMMTVNPNDSVLVTGQGMIGQMAAQCLRVRGARVMTTDLMPTRVRLSGEWSADLALNPAEQDLTRAAEEFAPDGFDLIVDTTGSNQVVNELWPLLRECSQLLLQGWYPGEVSFNFQNVHGHRPTIYVTSGHSYDDAAVILDLTAQDKLHIDPLVTHVIPYQQAPQTYLDLLEHGKEEFLGVVFDWREA